MRFILAVIVCTSKESEELTAILQSLDELHLPSRVLLILGHVELPSKEIFVDGGVSLDVRALPYVLRRENTFSTNFTSDFDESVTSRTTIDFENNIAARRKIGAMKINDLTKVSESESENMLSRKNKMIEQEIGLAALEAAVHGVSQSLQQRLLLVTDNELSPSETIADRTRELFDNLLESLSIVQNTTTDESSTTALEFFLYDRMLQYERVHFDATLPWRLITKFKATLSTSLMIESSVVYINYTESMNNFDEWFTVHTALHGAQCDSDDQCENEDAGPQIYTAVGGCLIVLLLLIGLLFVVK